MKEQRLHILRYLVTANHSKMHYRQNMDKDISTKLLKIAAYGDAILNIEIASSFAYNCYFSASLVV